MSNRASQNKRPTLNPYPSEEFFEKYGEQHALTPGKRGIPEPASFAGPPPRSKVRQYVGTSYSAPVARRICERIMHGETLKEIAKDPKMPSSNTVVKWLANPELADFREMYYYAKRVYAELLIEEIITLADDRSEDWEPTYDAAGNFTGWVPNNDTVQRSRLRIDTRKWLATKLLPKIYGDKVDVSHGVKGELADILKMASNKTDGLPPPIDGS